MTNLEKSFRNHVSQNDLTEKDSLTNLVSTTYTKVLDAIDSKTKLKLSALSESELVEILEDFMFQLDIDHKISGEDNYIYTKQLLDSHRWKKMVIPRRKELDAIDYLKKKLELIGGSTLPKSPSDLYNHRVMSLNYIHNRLLNDLSNDISIDDLIYHYGTNNEHDLELLALEVKNYLENKQI